MGKKNVDFQKSGFEVSIGTGLALETLFEPVIPVYDFDRIPPPRHDANKYDEIWFNVATLLRNIYSSLNEVDYNTLNKDDVASLLSSEMSYLSTLFNTQTNGKCKVKFYVCDYRKLLEPKTGTYSKLIKPRVAVTPIAMRLESKMKHCLEVILKEHHNIKKMTELKPEHRTKSLIFTHYVYDLLSHYRFSELVLLESNTGKIKYLKDWWSKYYPVPKYKMEILPFIRQFLLIFGDRHMFSPMPIKLRKQLLDLGQKCRWNPLTTVNTIKRNIENELNDKLVADMFNSI